MFGGMGNMGNMAGMMKKVQKMQSEMKKMQDELKRNTDDDTAGGGAVKVVMNGEKQVQSLTIDPAAVDPPDRLHRRLRLAALSSRIPLALPGPDPARSPRRGSRSISPVPDPAEARPR